MTDFERYFETKDIRYLHKWVEENYSIFYDLAIRLKKHYLILQMDKEELFSESIIAFYKLIDKYDPALGKPSTFIYLIVGREVLNSVKHYYIHDMERRVETVNLDSPIPGAVNESTFADVISDGTDESQEVIQKIMVDELNKYVETRADKLTRAIYERYKQGKTLNQIGDELGYTKQYVSIILKNLVTEVRQEWKIV